jgi:hypothetical protein
MIKIDELSDQEAAHLFFTLLDRAVRADQALYHVIFNDKVFWRVFDTLSSGKPQDE